MKSKKKRKNKFLVNEKYILVRKQKVNFSKSVKKRDDMTFLLKNKRKK